MRARQLQNWIHVHGTRDFAGMTSLAKGFRSFMAERFTLGRPEVVTEQISEDGTRKWLLRAGPGIEFETVFIPDAHRGTLWRHPAGSSSAGPPTTTDPRGSTP